MVQKKKDMLQKEMDGYSTVNEARSGRALQNSEGQREWEKGGVSWPDF